MRRKWLLDTEELSAAVLACIAGFALLIVWMVGSAFQ